MGVHHSVTRKLVLVSALFALVLGPACKKPPPPPNKQQTPPGPPDHLAPGELVEGKDNAFGLVLPRASEVFLRSSSTIHVSTPYEAEQVANFVRARVGQGKVTVGAGSTTFEDVTVNSEPTRHLKISVMKGNRMTWTKSTLTVLDVTPPPPADPNTTEEERWKKAGFKPNGQPLDPKHLQ